MVDRFDRGYPFGNGLTLGIDFENGSWESAAYVGVTLSIVGDVVEAAVVPLRDVCDVERPEEGLGEGVVFGNDVCAADVDATRLEGVALSDYHARVSCVGVPGYAADVEVPVESVIGEGVDIEGVGVGVVDAEAGVVEDAIGSCQWGEDDGVGEDSRTLRRPDTASHPNPCSPGIAGRP